MGNSTQVVVNRYRATTYSVYLFDLPGAGGHTAVTWDQLSLADIVIVCSDLSATVESTLKYLQYFKVLGVMADFFVVG